MASNFEHYSNFYRAVDDALGDGNHISKDTLSQLRLDHDNFMAFVDILKVEDSDSSYVKHVKGQLLKFAGHLVAVTHQNLQGFTSTLARKDILVKALNFMTFSDHYAIPDPLNADVCKILNSITDIFSDSSEGSALELILSVIPNVAGLRKKAQNGFNKQNTRLNLLKRLGNMANEDDFTVQEKVQVAEYLTVMIQDIYAERSAENPAQHVTIRQYFAGDSLNFISNLKNNLFDKDKAAWASAFQQITKIKIEGIEKTVSGAKYAELLGLTEPNECSEGEVFKFYLALLLAEDIKVNTFNKKEDFLDVVLTALGKVEAKQEFITVISLLTLSPELVEDNSKLYSLSKKLYDVFRITQSFPVLDDSVIDIDSFKRFLDTPESVAGVIPSSETSGAVLVPQEAVVLSESRPSVVAGPGVGVDGGAPTVSVALCEPPQRAQTPENAADYSSSDVSLVADTVSDAGSVAAVFSDRAMSTTDEDFTYDRDEDLSLDKLKALSRSYFSADALGGREAQIIQPSWVSCFYTSGQVIEQDGQSYRVSDGDKAIYDLILKAQDSNSNLLPSSAVKQIIEICKAKSDPEINSGGPWSALLSNAGYRTNLTKARYRGMVVELRPTSIESAFTQG